MSGGLSQPPAAYTTYNNIPSKSLVIVVDINGADYLTSGPVTLAGGITRGQRPLISLDGGSLTIAQRLEPEQGRASISTIAMSFVDKDSYMTKLISPGILIPEILGVQSQIWLGYAQTTFPQDYFVVWRGRVAQTNPGIGLVNIQFTDPNIAKRQTVFYTSQSTLTSAINAAVTTIPVVANGDFYKKILSPNGTTYDQTVQTYIKIDDEFIEYQQTGSEATGFGTNQFLNVVRGSRGTIAAAHAINATVDSFIQISGRAIDLALKIQMSGWNGPYLTNYAIKNFVTTGDISQPSITNAIVLKAAVDAVRDLGLAVGDYVTVTGDPNPSNNGLWIVQGFATINGSPNNAVLFNTTFVASVASPALLALRSQYDVYPITAGSKLPGWEVDVAGHIYYQNSYLNNFANSYSFFIAQEITGKTFIEQQIMYPLGAYCLTRQGKLSMGLTKPPIADERTVKLDKTNVLNPMTIGVQRGLNNRKFFNEIDWSYDYDDTGTALSERKTIDTNSLTTIGISSPLPIQAQGARTSLGFLTIVADRERFLLNRYSLAAVLFDMRVNFGTGNQIEAGDVLIVDDEGGLQIPNLQTGQRDLGKVLLEVINRSLDLKTGEVQLQLLGGLGSLVGDRYATITPSSNIVPSGSTTTRLLITESFGSIFPTAEQEKWSDYIPGCDIVVHSPDYTTRYATSTIIGLDPGNNHVLLISPALPFTPLAGDVVDMAPYSTSTDPNVQKLEKLIGAYLDPSVAVVSGVSVTSFNIGAGDVSKFAPGQTILVHNTSYSILSPEVTVLSIVGTLVTTTTSLGFIPAAGQTVELIGFADGGAPYRFI